MQKLERKGQAGLPEWHDQHSILLRELHIKPWQFPGVQRPGTGIDLAAQARYRLLEEALPCLSRMSLAMSLLGVKRTWLFALHMSAFDPKRTFDPSSTVP